MVMGFSRIVLSQMLSVMQSYYSNLRLTKTKKDVYYVSFYLGKRRFRFFNASILDKEIQPNKVDIMQRQYEASRLLLSFENALRSGWTPLAETRSQSLYERLIQYSPREELSSKYRRALLSSRDAFISYMNANNHKESKSVSTAFISGYLAHQTSSSSTFNHERTRLSVLFESVLNDEERNPVSLIKKKREKQELHKPFRNVVEVLNELEQFNSNLHLCCLLTYGCLLRPHQEIRNLRWSDFSEDLTSISLSGKRNKSGRNRIVPVSEPIRAYLSVGDGESNIFSGTTEPFSESYFKVLWRRFKKQSTLISTGQTLYSFRHTGALNVFEKTGSIAKLQRAMGHSDLKVTLTYLRGLEVVELVDSDMPFLGGLEAASVNAQ